MNEKFQKYAFDKTLGGQQTNEIRNITANDSEFVQRFIQDHTQQAQLERKLQKLDGILKKPCPSSKQ